METGNKGLQYKITWLKNILKHKLVLHGVKNQLARMGLVIMPYYWVLEESCPIDPPVIKGNVGEYVLCPLTESEVVAIQKRIKGIQHKKLVENLKHGQTCLGLKHADEVAAYMFVQKSDLNFKGKLFSIKSDEAYLKDMYTFEEHRGKNLAPYLRYQVYEILRKEGIHRKYSITEYFNTSTKKFKSKLNAQPLSIFVSINFFGLCQGNFKIKSFKTKGQHHPNQPSRSKLRY